MNQAMQTYESSMSCQGLIHGSKKSTVKFQAFFDYMMGEAIKYDKLNGADKKRTIPRRIAKTEGTKKDGDKKDGDKKDDLKKEKGQFAPAATSPWFVPKEKWAKMSKEARADHIARKKAAFAQGNRYDDRCEDGHSTIRQSVGCTAYHG